MAPGYQGNRDSFEFRRKSQRVFVDRATNDVILRLHATDIVRVRPNGDVILSTGGWATNKTMSSMNDAVELFDMYVECASGSAPQGRWQVHDSDGSVHPYPNDDVSFTLTIRSKGGDDVNRAKWLAEGYQVAYKPSRPAAAGTPGAGASAAARGAAPATVLHAPPVPANNNRAAAPASNGWGNGPAAAASNGSNSWANVTTPRTAAASSSGAHPPRVTGPGAAQQQQQQHHRTTTGPGAAAAVHRPTGPPGFTPAHNTTRPAGDGWAAAPAGQQQTPPAQQQQQQQQQRPAGAAPVGQQLEQHMQQLGLADEVDDEHLCVVCMEDRRTIVLVPCGHMALCRNCANTIIVEQKGNCPMCCTAVEFHVEVEEAQ